MGGLERVAAVVLVTNGHLSVIGFPAVGSRLTPSSWTISAPDWMAPLRPLTRCSSPTRCRSWAIGRRRACGSPPWFHPVVARDRRNGVAPRSGPAARFGCPSGLSTRGDINARPWTLRTANSEQRTTCSPGVCAAGTSRYWSGRSDPQPAWRGDVPSRGCHRTAVGAHADAGPPGCSKGGHRVLMADRPIATTPSEDTMTTITFRTSLVRTTSMGAVAGVIASVMMAAYAMIAAATYQGSRARGSSRRSTTSRWCSSLRPP